MKAATVIYSCLLLFATQQLCTGYTCYVCSACNSYSSYYAQSYSNYLYCYSYINNGNMYRGGASSCPTSASLGGYTAACCQSDLCNGASKTTGMGVLALFVVTSIASKMFLL